jgi:hypothetical protein
MTAELPLLLGAVAVGVLILLAPRFLARTRGSVRISQSLRELRAARHDDIRLVTAYHERLPDDARAGALDGRTWQDLDLDDVFRSLDYTASEPGRQYLYHMLRTPGLTAESSSRFDRIVRALTSDERTANAIRSTLTQLSDQRAAYLTNLFLGHLPRRPSFWWLFPVLTISAIACLALIVLWPRAIIVWLAVCVVNVVAQVIYKPRVKNFVAALHEVPAFLRVAENLGTLGVGEVAAEVRVLRNGANSLQTLGRATWWLKFEPGQSNELAASVYEYINLLFLFDLNAFVLATDTLRASRDVVHEMFRAIGYIDAAQSVAQWRATQPMWGTPEFTPTQKALHVESLVHPLVANAVPNSLDILGAGVLITGSNMSGKTTFVRALGVNAVLAASLHTVCARTWRGPVLRVRTSIGRADSVMEGKSYYLAEVESVLALVRAQESGQQHLFLLDEIFRGTNTTERIAAAYAVMAHLNRGDDLVVVATHDLEVLELLNGSYSAHHFREQIAGTALTFDYRLQPGPSSTRNAIALLEFMDYPRSLVADALAAVDRQRPSFRAESPLGANEELRSSR